MNFSLQYLSKDEVTFAVFIDVMAWQRYSFNEPKASVLIMFREAEMFMNNDYIVLDLEYDTFHRSMNRFVECREIKTPKEPWAPMISTRFIQTKQFEP